MIRADLPGIDPGKDVELTVSDAMLHIEAERREQEKREEKGYLRQERAPGRAGVDHCGGRRHSAHVPLGTRTPPGACPRMPSGCAFKLAGVAGFPGDSRGQPHGRERMAPPGGGTHGRDAADL